MDGVDWVIVILPFLAALDVASTLYVESLGNPQLHEVGFFASYFAEAGLIYLYVPIYLFIIIGIACVFWYIKRKLGSYNIGDKIVFVLLVIAASYVYLSLTETFLVNFFLPSIVDRGIDLFTVQILIYLSTIGSLVFYLYPDVMSRLRASENG